MKTITPAQQKLIYQALLELAQKQENILEQHSFDTDVEDSLAESENILNQLDPLLSMFFIKDEPIHLLTDHALGRIEKSYEFAREIFSNHDQEPNLRAGRIMGSFDVAKIYLKFV